MKGSKWTWLRDKCLELGYTKAAELAEEIEAVLHTLYGETKTEAWERLAEDELEKTFDNHRGRVLSSSAYCRGCEETKKAGGDCSKCKFGEIMGICITLDSAYSHFRFIFAREEIARKEEDQGKEVNEMKEERKKGGEPIMADTEKTEIHHTKHIDKELPSISYEKVATFGRSEGEQVYISVSDKTSEAAFDTFKKVRLEVVQETKQEGTRYYLT